MSHQREFNVFKVLEFVFLVSFLMTIAGGVMWISIKMEHADTPYHLKTLRAIVGEEEVMMDIIRAINRYETRVVPELPWDLQEDLVLTKENLLKPLEERLRRRQKLLDERKQKPK